MPKRRRVSKTSRVKRSAKSTPPSFPFTNRSNYAA